MSVIRPQPSRHIQRRHSGPVRPLLLAFIVFNASFVFGASVSTVGAFGAPGGGTAGGATRVRAQISPTDEPTLVVTGLGQVGAPAETAIIQMLFSTGGYDPLGMAVPTTGEEPAVTAVPGEAEASPAPGAEPNAAGPQPRGQEAAQGPARVTEEALEPMVQALTGAGVAEDKVTVIVSPALSSFFGPGGPGGGRVDAEIARPSLEQVNDLINAAADAADANGMILQQVGVLYDVADCAPLEREAKLETIANGRAQAEEMAALLGAELVALLQAVENPFVFPPFSGREGGCAPNPDYGLYGPGAAITAPPFDPLQPAEAKAYSQVTMVFTIREGAGTPTP